MIKCPKCNGRGSIGLTGKNEYGNVFYDFECDYCKGRGWVSEKKAEKYKTTHRTDDIRGIRNDEKRISKT